MAFPGRRRKTAEPGGAPGVDEERAGQREKGNGQDDGPDTVAPPPGRGPVRQNAVGQRRADPDGGQERHIRQRRQQGPIEQIARVGDEDLLENLEPRDPSRVEDLSGRIRPDVLRRRHLDVSEDVEGHRYAKGFKSTKEIGDLSHRRLEDR